MSLLDLNMLRDLCDELNKEINYQLSEKEPCLYNKEGGDYLQLNSDGNNIQIFFLGGILYCSRTEQELENIPVERQMDLNERNNFEIHIRLLINDKIEFLKDLKV